MVLIKTAITELCFTECLFKVILHSQIIDLLPLIVYSLQNTELTLQVSKYINISVVGGSHIYKTAFYYLIYIYIYIFFRDLLL